MAQSFYIWYIISDNFWSAFCIFHEHFCEKNAHFLNMCAKNAMIFDNYKEVISEYRSVKQRRINHSSWIAWPIRMWLRWGIVLWKESLCKTWIVFILIKCICFIIKMNHVWSRVKNIAFNKTNIVFPQKIVFPTNPLYSNMCTFLSHCYQGG